MYAIIIHNGERTICTRDISVKIKVFTGHNLNDDKNTLFAIVTEPIEIIVACLLGNATVISGFRIC
jgi:hypothetical protein